MADVGKTTIATDFISLFDLGYQPRTVPLAFDLEDERVLEFRSD